MTDEPTTEEHLIVDRRKNGYEEVERKLEDHAALIEARFRRWFIVGLIAFAVIGLSSFVALIGYGLVLRSQADFTRDIQQQRREATFETCQDQNDKNDHTKQALLAGSSKDQLDAPDGAARLEIRRRVAVTIALIDALVPKQDCAKLVKQRVPDKEPEGI